MQLICIVNHIWKRKKASVFCVCSLSHQRFRSAEERKLFTDHIRRLDAKIKPGNISKIIPCFH